MSNKLNTFRDKLKEIIGEPDDVMENVLKDLNSIPPLQEKIISEIFNDFFNENSTQDDINDGLKLFDKFNLFDKIKDIEITKNRHIKNIDMSSFINVESIGIFECENLASIEGLDKLEKLNSLEFYGNDLLVYEDDYIDNLTMKKKERLKNILKNKDGDELTGILESYEDDGQGRVLLLNITQNDLLNKNFENINQVGYACEYGDEEEIFGLIYFYFKKCIEWYGWGGMEEGLTLVEIAQKEADAVIEDEKEYEDSTSLILLYCEGTYVWCIGY